MKLCINIGLNIGRNNDELQHVNCTSIYKIRGIYQEKEGYVLQNTDFLQELQREFTVDTGASMHVMSKIDLAPEEQDAIQKSAESCNVRRRIGQSLRQKKLPYLDMYFTVHVSIPSCNDKRHERQPLDIRSFDTRETRTIPTTRTRAEGYSHVDLQLLETHLLYSLSFFFCEEHGYSFEWKD